MTPPLDLCTKYISLAHDILSAIKPIEEVAEGMIVGISVDKLKSLCYTKLGHPLTDEQTMRVLSAIGDNIGEVCPIFSVAHDLFHVFELTNDNGIEH